MAPEATGGPAVRRRVGLAVVRGDSMRPTLAPGDRLVVAYGARVQPGRVVVARFPDGTVVVKRVAERRGSGWWLLGDNPDAGVDSRHRGPIPDADLWGVARLRLWPRPRLL
ncbi:nickel-type superoxide dismutase maturation protease [Nocardioides sp. W3-2-3]|uniref:nickel-type superoxide dismutase maturation protease n=1 Tax=Nocardioides convexus TaxID=2712224 RepID=UPI002418A2FA|nr:nickel-type superoxide dismutase maturation protease [Nocardioides convexus]NHA00094.1 nickel-type superoxide dismutase maturation protease [Nocardioides convexus]